MTVDATSRSGRTFVVSRGRTFGLLVVLVLAGSLGGACSRARLTSTHGRAFHEVFTKQDANPGRKESKSIAGLDSQEAAIIAGSYRKGLAPKVDTGGNGPQLLMVNPNRGGGDNPGASMPSVPSGN
jgi:hypothetical protein